MILSRFAVLSVSLTRKVSLFQAWTISPTQWPRMCGGPSCGGNECGEHCGIRDAAGNLEVSLPGWFYQHGFFTAGMGKIFQCEKNLSRFCALPSR